MPYAHIFFNIYIFADPGRPQRGARQGREAVNDDDDDDNNNNSNNNNNNENENKNKNSRKRDPEGTLGLGTNHYWKRDPSFSGMVFRCGEGCVLEACTLP